jgi:hypothetical protein
MAQRVAQRQTCDQCGYDNQASDLTCGLCQAVIKHKPAKAGSKSERGPTVKPRPKSQTHTRPKREARGRAPSDVSEPEPTKPAPSLTLRDDNSVDPVVASAASASAPATASTAPATASTAPGSASTAPAASTPASAPVLVQTAPVVAGLSLESPSKMPRQLRALRERMIGRIQSMDGYAKSSEPVLRMIIQLEEEERALDAEHSEELKKFSSLDKDRSALQARSGKIKAAIVRLKAKNQDKQEAHDSSDTSAKAAEEEQAALETSLAETTDAWAAAESKLAAHRHEIPKLQSELSDQQGALNDSQTQLGQALSR